MANRSATFLMQTDALMRKNLTFQKRNKKANCRLVSFPFLVCLLFAVINELIKKEEEGIPPLKPEQGCSAWNMEESQCSVPSPPEIPPFLKIPLPQFRAVRDPVVPFGDLPDGSCRKNQSCPVTVLVTATNMSFGLDLASRLIPSYSVSNSSDVFVAFAQAALATTRTLYTTMFNDPALDNPILYNLNPQCTPNSTANVTIPGVTESEHEIQCLQALTLWRNSSSEINQELFKGYWNGNSQNDTNEILAAYDFSKSDNHNLDATLWYNATTGGDEQPLRRIARAVNLVSNTYLDLVRGPDFKILFEFIKEMPKHARIEEQFDVDSIIGPLLLTWIIIQLFPVMVSPLVYEKQQKLRIMMKMHGLSDGPYWTISYIYFLCISTVYMLVFVASCFAVGLAFFKQHDFTLQFVFYFVYLNLQIAFAFLFSGFFSKVKTASVVAYIIVFASGLIGKAFFATAVDNPSFSRKWVTVMELFPGFSIYRILHEFSTFSEEGKVTENRGMRWEDLSDSSNGMKQLLKSMIVEWFMFLLASYYVDQVVPTGSVRRSPLFFLPRKSSCSNKDNSGREIPTTLNKEEKEDVAAERVKVKQLLERPSSTGYAIICDNLKKVYPGEDGNPPKLAVSGLSLALRRGECLGMLGPNGAGKTSFIKMMNGLAEPSSGTAYVDGLSIRTDMHKIFTSMGVCPQHDLLWGTLTGREHLLFYGRLKNLRGAVLKHAVEESLSSVNLLNGGVADKAAGKYSGGMKRRLSVAISLIGDPKVVYMDEPSTGLDPASRYLLWKAVMHAKTKTAIILTTHSMEEAEHLCDRVGIFVDGSLQCIASPRELKARYGGFYVFTIATPPEHEQEVETTVRALCPGAIKTYHIAGTQKFELPKHEVRIADVFATVDQAKKKFTVQAWGLVDTTLEDVFIKVARKADGL